MALVNMCIKMAGQIEPETWYKKAKIIPKIKIGKIEVGTI
jgi:hypothetical protein